MKYSKTLMMKFKAQQKRIIFISDEENFEEKMKSLQEDLAKAAEETEDSNEFFALVSKLSSKYSISIAKE